MNAVQELNVEVIVIAIIVRRETFWDNGLTVGKGHIQFLNGVAKRGLHPDEKGLIGAEPIIIGPWKGIRISICFLECHVDTQFICAIEAPML